MHFKERCLEICCFRKKSRFALLFLCPRCHSPLPLSFLPPSSSSCFHAVTDHVLTTDHSCILIMKKSFLCLQLQTQPKKHTHSKDTFGLFVPLFFLPLYPFPSSFLLSLSLFLSSHHFPRSVVTVCQGICWSRCHLQKRDMMPVLVPVADLFNQVSQFVSFLSLLTFCVGRREKSSHAGSLHDY